MTTKKTPYHEVSSGNVFADLGLPDAPELQVKADLAYEISRTIDQRGLTQNEAAEILGVDQPKVSALVRGRLHGFSMERLYRFLNALGKDVEIVIRPTRGRAADANVRVTAVRRAATSRTKANPSARRTSRGHSGAGK
jgi:predicted XRE-type DNA-binding protein